MSIHNILLSQDELDKIDKSKIINFNIKGLTPPPYHIFNYKQNNINKILDQSYSNDININYDFVMNDIEFKTEELLQCNTLAKYTSYIKEKIPKVDTSNLSKATFKFNSTYGPAANFGYINFNNSLYNTFSQNNFLFSFYSPRKISYCSIKFRYSDSSSVAKTNFGGLYLGVYSDNKNSYPIAFQDPHNANTQLFSYTIPNDSSSLVRNQFTSNLVFSFTFNDFSKCDFGSNNIYYFESPATIYNAGYTTTGNPFYINYLKIKFT